MKISQRAAGLTPSVTLAVSAKAKKLRAEGEDVIGFGAGEPDFDTPQFIKDAAVDALNEGFTKYTPASGIPELRTAVAKYYNDQFGLDYAMENVIVSVGGKDVCQTAMQALVDPGDEVLIITPYWVSYPSMVTLAGGVPVYVETDETTGFLASVEMLKAKVTDRTRMLILNSPSNPTGAAYMKSQLESIAAFALENDIFVMSDEIYDRITYDNYEFVSFPAIHPDLPDNVLISNGWSKTYSMTGWRAGFGVGPRDVIGAMIKIQSHSTSGTSSITQKAALAATKGNPEELVEMLEAFNRRRDIMVKRLNEMPGVVCFNPQGAFYVFPKVSSLYGKSWAGGTITDSLSFCDFLLDQEKVALVPGVAFGADDFVRLSYATSDENIIEGLDRIARALSKLD